VATVTIAGEAHVVSQAAADSGSASCDVDAVWSSLGTGTANGVSSYVKALAAHDGKLFVGGFFTAAGGATANHMAAWDPDTNTWSSLGTGSANGVNNYVWSIAALDGKIFAGGWFTTAGGATANRVAAWDTATQTWSSLGTGSANGVNNNVFALAAHEGKVYVGGWFTTAGGLTANRVAAWDPATNSWSRLGDGMNSNVNALAAHDGKVYVGGWFTTAGGFTANRVAVWDIATQTWASLGTGSANGVGGTVTALTAHAGKVYVGGGFTTAGGSTANRVAVWDIATQTWSSLGTGDENGVDDSVGAFAVHDGKLYVGGDFTTAGGVSANRVAVWDIATQTWSSLGTGSENGVGGDIDVIAIFGGKGYVGGSFTTAGGVVANRVASWSCPSGFAPLTAPPTQGNPLVGPNAATSSDDRSLQALIDAAPGGGVIRLEPGVYRGIVNVAGKSVTIESIEGAAVTILDGAGANGSVITVADGGLLVLRGVTVQGGRGTAARVSDGRDRRVGGGVLVVGGHAVIESCVIRANEAWHGGGLAVLRGLIDVSRSTIVRNVATGAGGAMWIEAGAATLESTRVRLNSASASGGVWSCDRSSVTISSSEICWNESGSRRSDRRDADDACECAADVDGDGLVGERDLAALLDSWSTADPSADLNLDGVVNEADLSILLLEWSRPCATVIP
jgi:hypothetical protein